MDAMDESDLERQPLCEGPHPITARKIHCSRRHELIVVLLIALVFSAVWEGSVGQKELPQARNAGEESSGGKMQVKYETYDSEEVVQAPLESCIASLLMQETCLRPTVIFMALLLALLLLLCVAEVFHCCCCGTKPATSSVPEVEQLINGKEQLDEVLRRKSIRFLGEEWKEGTLTNVEIEEKIMRSWDVSHVEDNLELVDQVVRIMQDYPGLILHIKAFTITKLDRKQKSESIDLIRGAFTKDFSEDFPYERMDMELAYAHGRVLSLKRLLGHKHISHRRIRTSMEFGRERKLVLELEVPS